MKKNQDQTEQIGEVSEEELGEEWRHLPVKTIHHMKSNGYIVFTNKNNGEFDWEIAIEKIEKKEKFNREEYDRIIARLSEVNAKALNVSDERILREFREILGSTFDSIYSCDYKNADMCLDCAERFILKHHSETTRTWKIATTTIVSLIFVTLGFFLLWKNVIPQEKTVLRVLMYSCFGGMGVFISTFMNLNKRFMLIETGKFRVGLECVVHVFVGISLSFIGIFLVKNKLLLTILNDLPVQHSEILLAVIFASCEGFFPSFISNFDKGLLEESKENLPCNDSFKI